MNYKIFKRPLLLLFSASVLSAQALELDLNTAQQIALESNDQYKIAQEAVNKAKAQVTEARGGMLPSLSAFSQYDRAWDLATVVFDDPNFGPISFKMGTEHTIVYGLSFQQPLFLGGAVWSGYKMAKHGYNIAEASLTAARQDVLLQATSAYYGLLFSRSVVRVMEQAYATAQENLDQVETLRSVGSASDFDVLRAEVQVANLLPTLTSVKNGVKIAESQLLMVLGIEEQVKIVTLDSLAFLPNNYSDTTLDEFFDRALQNRSDIKIMEQQKSIMQKQVTLARSSFLPAVMFQTNLQYQGMKNEFDFSDDDVFRSSNSSISLSIPLFSGFKTAGKVQQAKAAVREADFQKDALYKMVRLEVETAYLAINEKEQSVMTQSKIIDQAEEALRLARLRYAEGLSTQLDVMNAESALNQARMNYEQSLFDYNIAVAQLKKALNEL